MSDGSEWVNIARETISEQRDIPLQLQSRLRNAFTAEIIASGYDPDRLLHEDPREGQISITFPKRDDGKPCMRIHRHGSMSYDGQPESQMYNNFIATKVENPNPDFSETPFLTMRRQGLVRVAFGNGYNARNDTTIIANSVDDLKTAVASLITNPLIRRELERDTASLQRE